MVDVIDRANSQFLNGIQFSRSQQHLNCSQTTYISNVFWLILRTLSTDLMPFFNPPVKSQPTKPPDVVTTPSPNCGMPTSFEPYGTTNWTGSVSNPPGTKLIYFCKKFSAFNSAQLWATKYSNTATPTDAERFQNIPLTCDVEGTGQWLPPRNTLPNCSGEIQNMKLLNYCYLWWGPKRNE